ncbi:MAG: methyl-accepting chemotaxis protein, partial [Sedimentisphaerales bacterium]|nr:methyl-accepting chemotaxis protein [Sedimentisphaerales bacterium]
MKIRKEKTESKKTKKKTRRSFSIRKKIAVMVGIPVLSLVVLVGLGWWVLNQGNQNLDTVVNDQFMVLIDNDITPLITDDMLPLINEDIQRLQNLEASIKLLLEADRDVHQAVIAEKMALVAAGEEESSAANQANQENIQQARECLTRASEHFTSEEAQQLYTQFEEAFAVWEEKTRKVIEQANTPGKLKFARKSSDEGSAFTTFNTMRDLIDQLQKAQEKDVQAALLAVEAKRTRINDKEKGLGDKKDTVLGITKTAQNKAIFLSGIFIVSGLVVVVVATIIASIVSRSITKPLKMTTTMLKDIAQGEGDLTKRMTIKSRDEIGELAQWFNTFVEKLQGIIQKISVNATTLANSSTELSATATQMSGNAETMSAQSTT